MAPVAFRHHLHDVIDRQLRRDFTGPVPADPIGKHGKQHRNSIILIEDKRGYSITVFVVLTRHACMGLGFHIKMSALDTDHKMDMLLVLQQD